MNEETHTTEKPTESYFKNVSVRAWLVAAFTVTVCLSHIAQIGYAALAKQPAMFKIEEPLYGLAYLAIGYYFGKSEKPK